jgi:membrane-associated phospholipid phosphatase
MFRTYFTKTNLVRLGLALLYLAPIVLFIKIATEVRERATFGFDIALLHAAHQLASPALDRIIVTITDLSGPEITVLLTGIAVVTLYLRQHRGAAYTLAAGVGGAAILNAVLKLSFQRVRPSLWIPIVHESSFSFPSGHAMASSALALTIMVLVWPTRWRWPAIVLGAAYIVLIGFTRVYLGVHYPSDVIGGWAVSFVWIMTMRAIISRRRAGYSLRALIWPWSNPK